MLPKTPKFWYHQKQTLLSKCLNPLSSLYQRLADLVEKNRNTYASTLPILCVGNLTVGGSGKTPVSIALLDLIKKKNLFLNPVFLTRGYGGSLIGPETVPVNGASKLWGDESLLLAKKTTTYKAQNRVQGIKYIEKKEDVDLVILDDGLQNTSLRKTCALAVINGQDGFGNLKTFPSGPLREPLQKGLARVNAVIIIGEDHRGIENHIPKEKAVFHADIQPQKDTNIENTPIIAFSGIARPNRFKDTLEQLGADIKYFKAFPDHYNFNKKDIETLLKKAKKYNAKIYTTEKDYARLQNNGYKDQINTLSIECMFKNEDKLLKFLSNSLKL